VSSGRFFVESLIQWRMDRYHNRIPGGF